MTDDASRSRRTFLKEGAAVAAGFTIVPRHVLGGPIGSSAEREGEHGAGRSRRTGTDNLQALFELADVQVLPLPIRPIVRPEDFYYGAAGRAPSARCGEH